MAKTAILRSSHNCEKTFHVLGLFSLVLLIQKSVAYEFKVGGSNGWTVPSDSNALNHWAETRRFQIGDSLLFVYPASSDSVLHVSKEDYDNCNATADVEKHSDGQTVFKLDQSGPYYFVSGVKENCLKNEKLVLVVMADRSKTGDASPPPSESTEMAPAPAPTTEETPPPPPPPPSGAASIVFSSISSIGALVGSSLFLAI